MEKSATISELAKALILFQGNMKTIGFDASNPFFKSKYATLAQLVEMSRENLFKHGLAVSQLCEGDCAVTTILVHTSGEYFYSRLELKPVQDTPQGRGSCITYSRRYSYAAILGLVSDDDDDANAASVPHKKADEIKPPEGALSMIHYVTKSAKEKFSDPDKFKAWRIDNNFPDKIEGLDELTLAQIWNALKKVKNA